MDTLPKVAVLLQVLGLVFAKEIPVFSNHLMEPTVSCPEVGYYFHREVLPNRTDPGPCYLCVCQRNSTAACWLRESGRCDVNHHQVGRSPRVRRSPVSLSDIFFRDATRDFFDKQLPEQCKPYESSFSEGCPPADWCIGCTVCDCDANGRWDCHILSFCNGEEKKKKVKRPRVPLPVMPTRRVYHKGQPKPKSKNTTLKPKKIVKKSIPKQQKNTKPANISRKYIKNQQNRKLKPPKKISTTKKPQQKRLYKKLHNARTTTRIPKKRFIRKGMNKPTTYRPKDNIETEVTKIMNAKSKDEQSVLGQKIVKRVMSTVQKMIQKEISKMNNTTRVQRSISSRDCSKSKKKDKKRRHHNTRQTKMKKHSKHINRNLITRRKREALDIDLSMIDPKDNIDADKDLPNNTLTVNDIPETNVEILLTTEIPLVLNTTLGFVHYTHSTAEYSNNASSTTDFNPVEDETTKSNLVVNLTETKSPDNIRDVYMAKAKDYSVIITNPNLNNIKHKKWDHIKISTNNMKLNEVLNFDRNVNKSRINYDLLHNKMRYKYIERKLAATNKYNLKQIISNNHETFTEYFNNETVKHTADNGNISSLQSILYDLIKNSNSTSPSKIKPKSNLFKYLRSMFKKIFYKKKKQNLKQNHKSKELQTLEILCENIGACFMNKYHRIALRSKLHELNAVTDKIFKNLKIIKGLLSLIKIPNNSVADPNEKPLNDDIKKLNNILKGTYVANNYSLSETQAAQISYIKENVHEFVRSVGRFASIINEIFEVLYKNNKKYGCQRKLRPSQNMKKQNAFIKLKNLIVKYNIIQNTFMKNMYKLLTDMENNNTTEKLRLKEIKRLSSDVEL